MTIQQALRSAVEHHQAGRLEQAQAIYSQILGAHPDQADALHFLGLLTHQKGRHADAWQLMQRSISLNPSAANYYCNAAPVLQAMGRLGEAADLCHRALTLKPDYPQALANLGAVLKERGQFDEALACYRRSLHLLPDSPQAHFNLGVILKERGELEEAIACYRRAIDLDANFAEAHNALGVRLRDKSELDEAVRCYTQALAIRPDFAEAHNNLGIALRDKGQLDDAIGSLRRSIALRPDSFETHSNLGNVYKDRGELDEAIACYRRALHIKPDPRVASNILYTMHFHGGFDARQIHEEHVRWNKEYAGSLASAAPVFDNDRSGERRLRVGYVSSDFNEHPIGRFLLPLLEHHDHKQFEVFAYADVRRPDGLTRRLERCTDVWRDTQGNSDEQLARLVRQDGIDILVDLNMHMEGTRMLTFARKPAPVQVTYLAYCGTTGLETIDYRFTDPYLDPPGQSDEFYSEKSIRLPTSYWCYPPPEHAPEVGPLPTLAAGHITFGCLNNYAKVSAAALESWCRILQAVPGSVLLLHSREGDHRRRAFECLRRNSIDPQRLRFVGLQSLSTYFRGYLEIDIALDPFPYPGGTTTCDALWMGVPVVSLAGTTAVSRAGLSILANVGLAEAGVGWALVARDADEYVRIVTDVAIDLPRLAQLRSTLRDRMRASPLMDAMRFTNEVEAAYRQIWRTWCAAPVHPLISPAQPQ